MTSTKRRDDSGQSRQRSRALPRVVSGLVVALLSLGAVPTPSSAAVVEAAASWSVAGTVYGESVVGPRLADVQVDVTNADRDCVAASTRTDADGTYTFSSEDADLSSCPSQYGYRLVARTPSGTLYIETGTSYSAQFTENMTADFVMPMGGTFSGQLLTRDAPQHPVVGATVFAWAGGGSTEYPEVTTDAEGRFTFPPLWPGNYHIRATAPGFDELRGFQRTVVKGSPTVLRLTIREFITVTGTVRNKAGAPLPGITPYYGVTTDAGGNYSLGPISPALIPRLKFSDPSRIYLPTEVAVPVKSDATGRYVIDAVLAEGAKVSGRVTLNSAGRPGAGQVSVELTRSDSPDVINPYVTTTDANGYYGITGIPPGTYVAKFTAREQGLVDQWWLRSPTAAAGFVITAGEGTVRSGVDALMEGPSTLGSVSGTVSLQSYPPRPEGGATVEIVRRSDGVPLYSAVTDSSGAYTVTGIMPGTYDVRFTPANQGFRTQWLGGTFVQSGSTPAAVPTSGSVTGIDIALKMKNPFQTAPTPTIAGGTFQPGYTLTAVPGTWQPTPSGFTFQWYSAGVAVPGRTARTYVIRPEDLGKKITVAVRGSRGSDTAQTKMSAATPAILLPMYGATPTITGTLRVGSTVTASTGVWTEGVTFSYSWKRDGVVIPGATAKTYVLQEADRGKQLSLSVKGTKTNYLSVVRTTPRTAAVLGVLASAPVPKLSGTLKAGSTLTATTGVWQPAPVTMKFTWQRNGVTIAGATAKTYVLKADDVGTKITVAVTGSKAGYSSITRKSAPTATIVR